MGTPENTKVSEARIYEQMLLHMVFSRNQNIFIMITWFVLPPHRSGIAAFFRGFIKKRCISEKIIPAIIARYDVRYFHGSPFYSPVSLVNSAGNRRT